MDSNVNSYTDDEFCKRFQELMENPLPVKDDPYFDSDEKLFGNSMATSGPKDISAVTLTLSQDESPGFTDGAIFVNIQARKGSMIKDGRFSCFVYSEDYSPMCNSDVTYKLNRKNNIDVSIVMLSFRIWLPGRYFLLLRDKTNGSQTRIDFEVDESMEILQQPWKACTLCSVDDILTSCVENTVTGWEVLSKAPGTFELRRYALESRQFKIYNEVRTGMGGRVLRCDSNLLIYTVNRDWDVSVFQAFRELAVPGHYLSFIDCNTFYNSALQNPYETLNEKMNNTSSQVYCLTNPGALLNTGGKVITRRIVEKISEDSNKYKLWLCGSSQEVESVLEVYPSLRRLFFNGNVLRQRPYTDFELVQAFMKGLEDENLEPTEQTMDALSRTILRLYAQGCLSTWSLDNIRRFLAEKVRPRYLSRALHYVMAEKDTLPKLQIEDIPLDLIPDSASAFEDSIRELNAMIGLDDIKRSIVTMAHQTRFFMERSKAGFHTTNGAAQHAIFTGNPGTGKTTVARMLGKIYNSIGLLSKGDVICADRTRLVGRYIGETEENMKAILEEARGNVLFIDEAYNLYEGTADRKDYGAKVIDSLLTVLSRPDPDMVIIFAGYEKEMDAMLSSNPGLMGRFPYKYRFDDYSAEQLMEIACHLFQKDDYILQEDARQALQKAISETVSQRTKNFGNARWVEQLVRNGILSAMADRMAQSPVKDYQHVLVSDVENGYRKFNPRMTELRTHRQVGFNA